MTACGSSEGGTAVSVPGFDDSALDVYEIEVLPDFSALQTVTEYPNRAAYLLTLRDPRVAAVSRFRADGLVTHWIYTAGEAQIDLGF